MARADLGSAEVWYADQILAEDGDSLTTVADLVKDLPCAHRCLADRVMVSGPSNTLR
jgi:hypothetical protein